MDKRYYIFLCSVVVVVTGQGSNQQCVTPNSLKCPNITSTTGFVCYSGSGSNLTAIFNCNGTNVTSYCTKITGSTGKINEWTNMPVNCTITSTEPDNGSDANFTSDAPNNGLTSPDNTMTSTITFPENTTVISDELTTSSENHNESVLLPKRSGDRVGVYIGVTITVVVIAIIVLVLLVWWRKRRNKTEKQNDVGFHNDAYRQQDGTHTNSTGIPMSELSSDANDNQYSEIPAFNPTNETDNEYNTIGTYNTIEIPDNDGHNNYNHVNTSGTISNNYSHMPELIGVNLADNTYSHIGNSGNSAQTEFKPKAKSTNDINDTYNTLQTSLSPVNNKMRKTNTKLDENDTEYNHLGTDLKREIDKEELNTDTYSHINRTRNMESKYEDHAVDASISNKQFLPAIVNNNVDNQLTNTGYEQVDGRTPYYMEFKVEDQADGGTTSGRSEQSFKVIEHTEEQDAEQEDESTANHHYFTLEKQSNA